MVSVLMLSVLLWTEVDNTGNGMLMSMHLWSPQDLPVVGSTHLECGLTNRRNPAKPLSCTCPRNVNIWPIFAMDHTGKDNKRVVFFDTITSTFFASDVDGCHYTSIFRPSGSESVGQWLAVLSIALLLCMLNFISVFFRRLYIVRWVDTGRTIIVHVILFCRLFAKLAGRGPFASLLVQQYSSNGL